MIQRFVVCKYGKKIHDQDSFVNFITTFIGMYNFVYVKKNEKDYELDKIVSKKIMIHLQTFFDKKWQSNDPMNQMGPTNNKNNRTKKYYSRQHNKTNKTNKKL